MTATASASSSSALALEAPPRGPLPRALLAGEHRELLEPLRFLDPGSDAPARAAALRELTGASAEPPADRAALAEGLAAANAAYGHGRARELAEKLADPATRVVVTGQQPGLFGGPLYSLIKALATARWAAALEEAGTPAVAVFWVATEDHDFAEVARAAVPSPGAESGLEQVDLGEDPEPLLPVGMRVLGPSVATALGRLAEAIPGDRYRDWLGTVGTWYRPDARLGEAFSRLLVHLLGDRAPLMLDAMLPEVKAAEAPWMRRLVERRVELDQAYAQHDRRIREAGFDLQVSPQPGASPLFLLAGGQRRRIEWRDLDGETLGGFALRGAEAPEDAVRPAAELLQILEENPGVVSPGVLARPAIQDAILGTCLQILGPGEMSYMPQAAATHQVLGLPGPATALRPRAAILDRRQQTWLAEIAGDLGLDPDAFLEGLMGDRDDLDRLLAGRAGGDLLAPVQQALEVPLADLRARALEVDPNLERPFDKTRDQIQRALGQFEQRLTAAAARRDEVRLGRIETLRSVLLPGGRPQERVVASAHFSGKYGGDLVGALWRDLDLDPRRVQVVTP